MDEQQDLSMESSRNAYRRIGQPSSGRPLTS